MPRIDDEVLFNFLLTQKSVTQETPYDVIEQVIQSSIQYVKDRVINARIANLALNINGKLVLAQVYVERQNGFVPTQEQQFGTTPTSYNVQIRFPFGLETKLNEDTVLLPSTDFKKPLTAYRNRTKVSDDVHRDYEPAQIVLGPGVRREVNGTEVILKCMPDGQALQFNVSNEIGKGYAIFQGITEYTDLEDYNQRLKTAGVYPLFYSSAASDRQGLLRRHNYRGYTNLQSDIHEPRNDGQAKTRSEGYNDYLEQLNQAILATEAGQYWAQLSGQAPKSDYIFNITVVNGTTLFTDSGLAVIRLRDYQLELFNNCQAFIKQVAQHNQSQSKTKLSGKIDMGVGAGKTFFSFTLLQYLKHLMQNDPGHLAPSFCLAPDEAVAEVTKKSINRQGIVNGMSAAAITNQEQMPNEAFMALYQNISGQAVKEAGGVDEYLNHGLQAEILSFCQARSLHPNKLINLMYNNGYVSRLPLFKDSIDVKRLLLLVEGQKTIKNKTGMLGVSALTNLLEQFDTIKAGISAGLSERKRDSLFADVLEEPGKLFAPDINYNQVLKLPYSMVGAVPGDQINITNLGAQQLIALLNVKNRGNRRAVRDDLMRIACLKNNEAAILLANSGGLGNTSTAEEIEAQIERFLPDAAAQIHQLANKDKLTGAEHYQLFVSLGSLFSTIPDAISLKPQIRSQDEKVEHFEKQLYLQSLRDNLELVDTIRQNLQTKIKELTKVEQLSPQAQQRLQQFNIQPETSLIEATNQLAGLASMQLTGTCVDDDANLLLTHIPVFTPEGMACYIEHLASLEQQPKAHFKEHHGIYGVNNQGKVSKKDIQNRLQQFLSAIMVADEVHKEEFKFLYDTKHPLYQRINRVTQKYLQQEFKEVLPHRVGMSGTMNEVAEKAFGTTTLYSLPTQKMIQQGLMKKVGVDTQVFPLTDEENSVHEYAKQIVVDYFTQTTNLSLTNVLSTGACAVDLFQLSKGLIFSKTQNEALNKRLVCYFNLLLKEKPSNNEQELQAELFGRINEKRRARTAQLQDKLAGVVELSVAEIEQINLYNRASNRPITIENKRIRNAAHQSIQVPDLNPQVLQSIQRKSLQNNNFALYLEYILSKSSAPKEFSDIIGLQNNLFEQGIHLIDFANAQNDKEVRNFISLINSIDTKSITLADVTKFVEERIKDPEQRAQLINGILTHKNKQAAFAKELVNYSERVELGSLIATEREQFEAGKTLLMLGSARERTGYSHEPVGIIMDVPANVSNQSNIATTLAQLQTQALKEKEIPTFLTNLQTLAYDSFSYDEKNQAGGRALRTPYGHVRYVEYQTGLNPFLVQYAHNSAIQALKLETQFQEIFTSDEILAQEERESITFNREAILLLEHDCSSITVFSHTIQRRFAKKLSEPATSQQYNQFIAQRLPLLWSMKYQPNLAQAYFAAPNEAIFDGLRLLQQQPVAPIENRQRKSVVNQKTFYQLLAQLQIKTDSLIDKGNPHSGNYEPEYTSVGEQAQLLNQTLVTAAQEYYAIKEPTELRTTQFRDSCLTAINNAKAEFGAHRGWGDVNFILRGIVGLFAFLTVVPALIVACTAKHGYSDTFFGSPPTESLEILEEFESSITSYLRCS